MRHYLLDIMFTLFDAIQECDRHTQSDGQTHVDGIYCA